MIIYISLKHIIYKIIIIKIFKTSDKKYKNKRRAEYHSSIRLLVMSEYNMYLN